MLAVLVARRHGLRQAAPYALGGLVSLPLVIAYWPKGYVGMFDGATSATSHPWALSYVDDAWRHSLLFTPRFLLLLAPLLVIGCFAIRDRWVLPVLCTPIVVNAVVYSFYYVTALHPRFLYVDAAVCIRARGGRSGGRRRCGAAATPRSAAGTRSVSVDGDRRPCG